jgi:hypothetical protein
MHEGFCRTTAVVASVGVRLCVDVVVRVGIWVGVALGPGVDVPVGTTVGAVVAGAVEIAVFADATTVAVAPGELQLATIRAKTPSSMAWAEKAMAEVCRRMHILLFTLLLPLR